MAAITLEQLDQDGALREGLAGITGSTRSDFLRRSVVGGTVLLAACVTPAALAIDRDAGDRAILNFALSLEYLQDAFYTETERIGALTGRLARQARVVGSHERAHVKALQQTLGRDAIPRPRFNFHGATESENAFRRTAVAFEDLAVAAYKGQAPRLHSLTYLAAAIAIHSVEARHAAWIRHLAGIQPAAHAFDDPITKEKAAHVVASTHFVVTTQSHHNPRYTG